MEFTILVNFHGHYYYMFSLSEICQGVEKKIFKDLMHFHNMTKVATWNLHFWYRLPCSSFLYIQFVWNMPRRREEDFSKTASILQFFTPKLRPLRVGGSWHLQLLVSFPYRCHTPNLVKIGPVVSEEEMLTADGQRKTHIKQQWTLTHSNRSLDSLRWPKIFFKI